MDYCDWFCAGWMVALGATTWRFLLKGGPVLFVIRKYGVFLLLFFITGSYFQFIIRVTQARSFESLDFYLSGALFASIDSWLSLLTVALCTKLLFKKFGNRFLETV